MSFQFTRRDLDPSEERIHRFFEILPGLTSWTILLGMCFVSFWKPLAAAMIVIAFDLYWLLRLFYMTIFLVLAYFRLAIEAEADWMGRMKSLKNIDTAIDAFKELPRGASFGDKVSRWIHLRELEELKKRNEPLLDSEQIYHLVLFPVLKERRQILEPGLKGISRNEFPSKRVCVVYALEERAEEEVKEDVMRLQEEYRDYFMELAVVIHPMDLPGEARVKGANVTCAARWAVDYFQQKNIPFDNIIVSCFDADTIVSPNYFGCLSYSFLICPNRNRASFQPIPVYHNNIWEAPGFARVLEMGSSFFQLVEATDPEKLVTFSSHSMSFRALIDVDFWPVDMISDDSAIFWKSFIHFNGDYQVVPMYVTLSMDVVASDSWWRTIGNLYKQKRRWAWGVENFPLVMRGFLQNKKISFFNKFRHGYKLFEAHVAWATWAFLLTILGWLPAMATGREFSDSVLYYSAPRITGTIFNLATLAFVTTIILSLYLLPKKRVRNPFLNRLIFAVEWLFVPLIVIFLSAIPALDAQTRLMFGKYMEFWVTDKQRKAKNK